MGDKRTKRPGKAAVRIGAVIGFLAALALAVLNPSLTALGNKFAIAVGIAPLVTSSDDQAFVCWGGTFFVPNDDPATYMLPSDVSPSSFNSAADCNGLLDRIGGVPTSNSIVASVRAETDTPVTITHIDVVNVTQSPIPTGTYVTPARVGGYYPSKFVILDLDQTPVAFVDVGEYVEGVGGSYITPDSVGLGTVPLTDEDLMRVPWKVTKDEPLELFVMTQGTRFDTTFTVKLSWRSGSETGEVLLDNAGRGYRSIGSKEGYGSDLVGLLGEWVRDVQ